MLPQTLLTLLLTPSALALTHPRPHSNISSTTPTWLIPNYFATVDSHGSYLTFTFNDPDPDNRYEIMCTRSPAFKETWQTCGDGETTELMYKATEDELVLRRKLKPWSRNSGIARQRTYWNYGSGGNVTKIEGRTTYTRTEAWLFPIQAVVG